MQASRTDPIFISYSRRDTEIMRRIVLYLRDQGFNVWVDNEKLIPGTPVWEEEIEKAIKTASAVIVVMSPDSKNSEWVRREISLADQYRKYILPILVRGDEDSSTTLRLVTRQFVDLRKNETTGLALLHNALAEYLGEIREPFEEKSVSPAGRELATTTNARIDISGPDVVKLRASPTISQSLLWFTLGWAIAGFLAGILYSSDIASEGIAGLIGGAVGGAIGGFVTSIVLRTGNIPAVQITTLRTTLAWTIGGAIGWAIGWGLLTEASGAGIGMAIFPLIGLAGALGMDYVLSNWKSIATITLAWAISSAIGWIISRTILIDSLDADKATSWAIGTAIAWALGGFVLCQQMLTKRN